MFEIEEVSPAVFGTNADFAIASKTIFIIGDTSLGFNVALKLDLIADIKFESIRH